MSKQKTYETFREARSNSDATSRMLDIFRATEPGIIMETPEMAETINEIVRFSVSEDARNIGPRWMGVRPEVIVTSLRSTLRNTDSSKPLRIQRATARLV